MSQRRKVISGFSLGVGVSLLFLTLILLNNTSLSVPKVQVFLQGSDSNSSSSSFSWRFPFTTTLSSNASVSPLHRVEVNVSSSEGSEKSSEETLLGNLTGDQKNASLHDGHEEDDEHCCSLKNVTLAVKENALVGNSSCNGGGSGVGKCEDGLLMKESNNNDSISVSVSGLLGECDIFDGKWVRDEFKPYYPLGSCPNVDRDFDCHLNGRPDSEYVKWKWQPNGCDIPRYGDASCCFFITN